MWITKARLRKVTPKKTKITLEFDVKEYSEDFDLLVTQSVDADGYIAFSADVLKREVEEAMKNRSIGVNEQGKSKSQILRGRIYKYWNEQYSGTKEWEEYYSTVMDALIEKIK